MRYLCLFLVIITLFITSCGTTNRISKEKSKVKSAAAGQKIEEGVASWYGPDFHGKLTADGERYNMNRFTAAHRTLPFNTIVEVKNLDNGKSVNVRINDRGPYAKNRIIDLSKAAAKKIDMLGPGTAHVALILLDGNLKNSNTKDLKVPTYTIQLASFQDEAKAFELSRKLRGSRVERARLNNMTVYRVYFGTYVNKHEALKEQHELKRQGYTGYVKQIQN
ncbi:MAG TPA: septal ring lytic transglycosylase RlpA family protein [Balneolaceae bacterium]|nr:septal ring lytic transglycosylase RlpA family protein [Balneolaceae bacterium]